MSWRSWDQPPNKFWFELFCDILQRRALLDRHCTNPLLNNLKNDAEFMNGRCGSTGWLDYIKEASEYTITRLGCSCLHGLSKPKPFHMQLDSEQAQTNRLCLAAWLGDLEYLKAHEQSKSWSDETEHAFDSSLFGVDNDFSSAAVAAYTNRLDLLDYLLCHVKSRYSRFVALVFGAQAGHRGVAEIIFRRDPNLATEYDLRPVLDIAAGFGHVEILRDLVDRLGIAPEGRNYGAYRALLEACRNGHTGAAGYLLPFADLNSPHRPWICILNAARAGRTRTVALFIPRVKTPSLNNFYKSLATWHRGRRRTDPLTEAARFGHLPVARLLLQHGFNVNGYEDPKLLRTPLIAAIKNEHTAMAQLLLDNGASVKRELGIRALQVAQKYCGRSMVKILEKRGAKYVLPQRDETRMLSLRPRKTNGRT